MSRQASAVRGRLDERLAQLRRADYSIFPSRLRAFIDFVRSDGALRSIMEQAAACEPSFDAARWMKNSLGFECLSSRILAMPETEAATAVACWHVLCELSKMQNPVMGARDWVGVSKFDVILDRVREAFFEPLAAYLCEGLGSTNEMLWLLERYKRRLEWFRRDELYALWIREPGPTDRRSGHENTPTKEAVYDDDLRMFLIEQGIDYPFSQPRSGGGQPDIVAQVDTDDPLVCEVKVYDGARRNIAWIASGVHQARTYASDYHKHVAYLVIFNISENPVLRLPCDEPATHPPRLLLGNHSIVLFLIDARPRSSASKLGKAHEVVVSRADLIENP